MTIILKYIHIYIFWPVPLCVCVCVCVGVIFNNRLGVLYRGLKRENIDESFRPDKARTGSFLNVL